MSARVVSRRRALQWSGAAAIAANPCLRALAAIVPAGKTPSPSALAKLAPFVQPHLNWGAVELDSFLDESPPEVLLSMKKALELVGATASPSALKGGNADVAEIQKQLLWVSSNIVEYPFHSASSIEYHELVKWVAGSVGVDPWIIDTQTTFIIERAYLEKLFASMWDSLSPARRQELLSKVEQPGQAIANKAGVATLSGAGAWAVLATTEYFAGFAFYTTMSTAICTVAGWVGVTLPFAAYSGASSAAAFLCGPIGWAALAVAAAIGLAIAGRANSKKTGAALVQIHTAKVAALSAAGMLSDALFRPVGDPLRLQLVGKWKWHTAGETLEFQLNGDGSMTSESHPDARPSIMHGGGFVHSGRGEWRIRDKKLTISQTSVWTHLVWVPHQMLWIDGQKIVNASATAITLANGQSLVRE